MTWKIWLHGLFGAVIGGVATVASGFAVGISLKQIGEMALVAGVSNAGLYLAKSPIWSTVTTVTQTETPGTSKLEVKEEKQ